MADALVGLQALLHFDCVAPVNSHMVAISLIKQIEVARNALIACLVIPATPPTSTDPVSERPIDSFEQPAPLDRAHPPPLIRLQETLSRCLSADFRAQRSWRGGWWRATRTRAPAVQLILQVPS